ncbi:MAG: molecular chaperone HtpG [Fastidiosipilaceae bacterium]|jgi:molecular chaperone HtpG
MSKRSGKINVSTENIFPIIRKWLYSDEDIFVREMIANGTDAIAKLERLTQMGDVDIGDENEYRVDVVLDTEQRTISFEDNGIGMTMEEIDKYINEIAYSGAVDFVEKCRQSGESGEGIIGHFGLGFYSAFMVADKVTIESRSYLPDAKGAYWMSETGTEYEMEEIERAERGTKITLYLSEESAPSLTGAKVRETIQKYCEFMPRPIYFLDIVADREADESRERRSKEALESYEKRKKEALDKNEEFSEEPPTPEVKPVESMVNDVDPLWNRNPGDCTDDDYRSFYHQATRDFKDPLFWIHLNMDYPFHLKGILYFPEMENRYQTLDGRIKLYSNQVFVADNVKEIIPDFLFLLKGFIDCPDIPLNVSRSYLQTDSNMKKLSGYIVRKVADQLNQLFKKERDSYEKYWEDIHVFIKYGCLTDDKFYERIKDSLIYRSVDDTYKTAEELGETVYYTVDPEVQINYIRRAEKSGKTVVVMNDELDIPFMSFLENKQAPRKFRRIDAALEGEEGQTEWLDSLTEFFRDASGEQNLKIEVKAQGEEEMAGTLIESEEARRTQEMRKQFERMQGKMSKEELDELFPVEQTLVVNTDSRLVSSLKAMIDIPDKRQTAEQIAQEIVDLARLSHGSLQGDALDAFLKRSTSLLQDLVEQ